MSNENNDFIFLGVLQENGEVHERSGYKLVENPHYEEGSNRPTHTLMVEVPLWVKEGKNGTFLSGMHKEIGTAFTVFKGKKDESTRILQASRLELRPQEEAGEPTAQKKLEGKEPRPF